MSEPREESRVKNWCGRPGAVSSGSVQDAWAGTQDRLSYWNIKKPRTRLPLNRAKPKAARLLVSGGNFLCAMYQGRQQRFSLSEKGTLTQRDAVDSRCLRQETTQNYMGMSELWKILIYSHPLTCNRINHKYIYSIVFILVHLTSILLKFPLQSDKKVYLLWFYVFFTFSVRHQLEF